MTDIASPPTILATLQRATAGLYRPRWLALVMLVQALLLASYAQNSWHASPDCALYLGLARSMVEGQGYVFNYQPHAMVPPLWPGVLAGMMKAFGPSFLAMNIMQALLALACTPLVFWLMRRMVGADLAMLCTALFSLNYDSWDTASILLSDHLFTILAVTSMALLTYVPAAPEREGSQSGKTWLALGAAIVTIVASTFTRINGIVLVPAAMVTIYLGWPRRGRMFRAATACMTAFICLAPILAWQAAARAKTTGADTTYLEASYLNKPLGEMLRGAAEQLLVLLPHESSNLIIGSNNSLPVLSLLVPILAILGSVLLFKQKQWALPTALWFMFGLLSVSRGVVSRYLIFLLPGLPLLVIMGIIFLLQRLRRSKELNPASIRKVLLPALACLLLMHVIHSAAGAYRCIQRSVPNGSRIQKEQGWLSAGEYILAHDPQAQAGRLPSAIILTPQSSVMHYWTRAKTLPLRNLNDSTEIRYQQVSRYHPDYLVATAGEKRLQEVFAIMNALGGQAIKLDDVKLPGNVMMWRLTYPAQPTGGAPNTPAH